MAEIKSKIGLQDQVSPVLRAIMKSMVATQAVMRSMQSTVEHGIPDAAFNSMNDEIIAANAALDNFVTGLGDTGDVVNIVTNEIHDMNVAIHEAMNVPLPGKLNESMQKAAGGAQHLKGQLQTIPASAQKLTGIFDRIKNGIVNTYASYQQFFNKLKETPTLAGKAQFILSQMGNGIRNSQTAISNFITKMRTIPPEAERIKSSFSGWQSAIITANQAIQLVQTGLNSLNKVAQIADNFSLMQSKLKLVAREGEDAVNIQNEIFAAAERSRGSFTDMAGAVGKMGLLAGDAFKNTNEIVAFTETLNKAFVVGGAGLQEQQSAMYQLTQAMASGKLQGDEFRSIMENAPMLADAIAKYMGRSKGELKELSSEGLISADIIKNALFSVAGDINDKFRQIPMTWGQAMQKVKNYALVAFEPLMQRFSALIQSEEFKQFLSLVIRGVTVVANTIMWLIDIIGKIGLWFKLNWEVIQPMFKGIATAITMVLIPAILAMKKAWLLAKWKAISTAVATAAAWLVTNWPLLVVAGTIGVLVACWGNLGDAAKVAGFIIAGVALIISLAMLGVTWPILLIIGIVLLVVGAFVFFGDTATDVCGVIGGAFAVLGAFLWDLFLGVLELVLGVINYLINPFINFANFIGNVFKNPISSVIYLFQGMADNVLGILEKVASALDFVFGSGMAKAVAGWRSGLKGMADAAVAKFAPNENYQKIIDPMDLSADKLGFKRAEYGTAYNSGKQVGVGFGEGIQNGISSIKDRIGNLMNGYSLDSNIANSITYDPFDGVLEGGKIDKVGRIGEPVTLKEEDIKSLKSIAQTEIINRFTSLKPSLNVDIGEVKETADVNELLKKLENLIAEAYASALSN